MIHYEVHVSKREGQVIPFRTVQSGLAFRSVGSLTFRTTDKALAEHCRDVANDGMRRSDDDVAWIREVEDGDPTS